MRARDLLVGLLAVAILAIPACSKRTESGRTEAEAYQAARSAYYEAETPEARAAIAEEYLAEFPDGEHAASFVWVEVANRAGELGEKERAWTTVSKVLDRTTDPARRLEVTLILYPLARELGTSLDIGAAVAALERERPLRYREHQSIMELASEHGEWALLLDHAGAALALATPEAVAAERSDGGKDAEKTRRTARQRSAEATAYKAWALFNLGRTEEADGLFAAAMAETDRNYVGLPTTPAARFWGSAALAREDWDRAMELLAPEAIMGSDTEAMAGLRKAWIGKHGSDEGLEEYLWTTRQSLARTVDDFSLADYEGSVHTLSEELQRVTLLALWFPT